MCFTAGGFAHENKVVLVLVLLKLFLTATVVPVRAISLQPVVVIALILWGIPSKLPPRVLI